MTKIKKVKELESTDEPKVETDDSTNFLTKNLPSKVFFLFITIILTVGLLLIGGLHYILNIQYQSNYSYDKNGPITTAPVSLNLEVEQPDEDILVFQSSLIISGTTAEDALVLISSNSYNSVITANIDGSFSTVVSLKEGINDIDIVTFDKTGDQRSTSRTVYYSKEKI